MRYFTRRIRRGCQCPHGADGLARPCRVMASLVTHLHAFVKDVELTEDEWAVAIDF